MTSKDRIRAAFAHRQPDRVPLFEQSVASDVASELLGREAFTGTTYLHYQEACAWMRGEEAHREFAAQVDRDVLALARLMGWDMLSRTWSNPTRPTAQLDEYNFLYGDADGDHHVMRFDPDAKTFQVAERHSAGAPQTADDLEVVVESHEQSAADLRIDDPREHCAWHVARMAEVGDEFEVVGGVMIGIPLDPVWLIACLDRPDLVARYLDAQLESNRKVLEAQAAVGIHVLWGGGDFAANGGPIYGPRVWRELVLPRAQALCEKCHELGMVYVYRTDGDLWPIEQEFFVESGIDGYGEIDYDAGMDMDRLKARHGERLTFWGNVPCGSVLHLGTEHDVREFTRHLIDVAAPGGGFILGSSNSIIPGTPVRNVMAMVETAHEYQEGTE